MVVRRRRKYRKKLGGRTFHGDTKNRRGKGIKGGRGRAGAWDHKKSTYRYEVMGKKGFVPPRKREEVVINLRQINEIISSPSFKGDEIDVTEMGYTKVLGTGSLSRGVTVIAYSFSERAKEKIEAAGGKAVIKE
ncbi:MAG: 50S ribosomal protein L15 [Candidatus Diapherotrites archaeon]|nr:50S ribosomal protein L15 [Candidatus Diapherotrites archaeon]